MKLLRFSFGPQLAFLAFSAAAPSAWAQAPAPVAAEAAAPAADPRLDAAKADFEEAQILFIKEQWDGAAAKFVSAYEKKPFVGFLFNAAVANEKAKRIELAIDYFSRYLKASPDAKDARDVELRVAGLKRILAAQSQPPQPGKPPEPVSVAMLPAIETKGLVIIDSKPQGATIYLNDKTTDALGTTRWEGSLEPKPVTVILEAKGFKPEKRLINPRPDKILEVYIALSEEHFLGWVEIASNVAGAEVYIDRKEIGAVGKTPFSGHLKPGKHLVWVERTGYVGGKSEIDVQPGTATSHQINLERAQVGWIAVVGKRSKGGRLLVDGKFACNTPCQQEAKIGARQVVVEHPDMENYEGVVQVAQSTQTLIDVQFSPKPPKTRGWTTAVISALFLGGGIYAGLQANSLEDELRGDIKKGKLVDSGDDRVTKGKIFAISADVAFGLATITGIMAIVNFVSNGPPSKAEMDEKVIGLAPIPLPGGGGLAATGRF